MPIELGGIVDTFVVEYLASGCFTDLALGSRV